MSAANHLSNVGKAKANKVSTRGLNPLEDDWQGQSDMRTLLDAHKIKNDPHRHRQAMKHAKAHLVALQSAIQPTSTSAGKKK